MIQCFILDPTVPSGLRWRERPLEHFSNAHGQNTFNAQNAGEPAGALHKHYNYWVVTLTFDGRKRGPLKTHRIVYALTKGEWPPDEVDHENRERADNEIGNLREATHGQNMQNTTLRSDNVSGFKGVSWNKKMHKWNSNIAVDGRDINLGYHTDILDALVIRQHAEREMHPFHVRPRLDADIITVPLDLPAEDIEEWKREVPRGLWQLPPRIHLADVASVARFQRCVHCETSFTPKRSDARYCSAACGELARRPRLSACVSWAARRRPIRTA